MESPHKSIKPGYCFLWDSTRPFRSMFQIIPGLEGTIFRKQKSMQSTISPENRGASPITPSPIGGFPERRTPMTTTETNHNNCICFNVCNCIVTAHIGCTYQYIDINSRNLSSLSFCKVIVISILIVIVVAI
jgi:hypothetical protein